jgi:DNA mismatch repair protein MSH3
MSPTASPNKSTQQATISAFFSASPVKAPSQLRAASSTRSGKRSASPIVLDSDGDGDAPGPSAPAAKKAKIGGGTTSKFFASKPPATVHTSLKQEPGSPTLPTPSSSTAQQWRFVPSSEQDPASTHTEHEDAEKVRRHEAFRKALLSPRDPFAHRASLADARSVEELRQLQADADASAIPDDELGEDEDDTEEIVEVIKPKKGKAKAKAALAPEEEDESDPGFKSLMAGFASGTRKVKSKPKAAPKPKKAEAPLGPCGLPYTPLELQVLELKKAHPGTLLMVEVGYKYLFYEEDARVGSLLQRTENKRMLTDTLDSCKGAWLCCLPKAQSAHGIDARGPTRRASQKVHVASGESGAPHSHTHRFLSRGYKVGIVAQTETVALKQISEGKNKLFARGITALYTATTYVDPLGSADEETTERHAGPALVCIVELADADGGSQPRSSQRDENVRVGWVAVSPSTGDVVWDEFEGEHPFSTRPKACYSREPDGPMRTELETRLGHTLPGELLLPAGKLSGSSEKMLTHFAACVRLPRRLE